MNSCHFKFKPDKIKYLSTIDTLDSTHKNRINNINRKRDDLPKKLKKLFKLKNDLSILESKSAESVNYIAHRAKLIEDISKLEEDIFQIENYEDELDYYTKTHDILLNYYDIIDGQNINEINNIKKDLENQQKLLSEISLEQSPGEFDNVSSDAFISNDPVITINEEKFSINNEIPLELCRDSGGVSRTNPGGIRRNEVSEEFHTEEIFEDQNIPIDSDIEWNLDNIKLFNNKTSKLDLLNQLSKLKRKDKKTTRKRVKNVESLIKDYNNNIFDYIDGNKHENKLNIQTKTDTANITNTIISKEDASTHNNLLNSAKMPINQKSEDFFDRATLFEDYKILLEGYPSKKRTSRPCITCGIDKVLIYSEGLYACMNCGEVENCIVESEVSNYKDPMIEKPTFPYKRKNHFCEWIYVLFYLTARKSRYQKYLLV